MSVVSKTMALLNSNSTDIPEKRLTLSDICRIITVPYGKSTVHTLYRATVPFGISLDPTVQSHCALYNSLVSTVLHCTPLYGVLTSTVPHCTPEY